MPWPPSSVPVGRAMDETTIQEMPDEKLGNVMMTMVYMLGGARAVKAVIDNCVEWNHARQRAVERARGGAK